MLHRIEVKKKRYDWLVAVIRTRQYRVGAEIGCAQGYTTFRLLKYNRLLRLYAVDLWDKVGDTVEGRDDNYDTWNFEEVHNKFKSLTAPYKTRMIILKGITWEMAEKVKDNSLDFVFIDAGHNYESVSRDIKAWTPKLRQDGMLSGHDCNMPGVEQALNEFVPGWRDVKINNCWEAKKEQVCLSK